MRCTCVSYDHHWKKKRKPNDRSVPTARTVSDVQWDNLELQQPVHLALLGVVQQVQANVEHATEQKEDVSANHTGAILWGWDHMDCHLDSFLAIQLAFFGQYSQLIKNSGEGSLYGTEDRGTKRLLKVLLGVNEHNKDHLRDEYWKMSLGNTNHRFNQDWKQFGSVMDHRFNLLLDMPKERRTWTRELRAARTVHCSSATHDTEVIHMKKSEVNASVHWWPMPDLKYEGLDGKSRVEPCVPRKHENMRSILLSLVARNSELTLGCTTCGGYNHKSKKKSVPKQNFQWIWCSLWK